MAQTIVELDTKKHDKMVRAAVRRYRLLVFKSLAMNLDHIRTNAVQYIIRRRADVSYRLSPYQMAKKQPATSGKVTERTGRLIKMLLSKGKWNFSDITSYDKEGFRYTAIRSANMHTHSLAGRVKVLSGLNSDKETYRAELRVDIQAGNPLLGNERGSRVLKVIAGEGESYKFPKRVTKQQLAIRFKHDTGIRGHKRPFITPAAQKEEFYVASIIKDRLNELKGLGI